MNFTWPGIWFLNLYKIFAVANNIAVWVSCPQACITGTVSPLYSPVIFDAQGISALSFTGSPSISALSPTTGPGFPSFKIATTPVLAIPVWGLYPIFLSSSAILWEVLNSLLLNSAFWWNQCLNSMISSRLFSIRSLIFWSKFWPKQFNEKIISRRFRYFIIRFFELYTFQYDINIW